MCLGHSYLSYLRLTIPRNTEETDTGDTGTWVPVPGRLAFAPIAT